MIFVQLFQKMWKIAFQRLSLSFSESMRKMLHNGGVESLWGALGASFPKGWKNVRAVGRSKNGVFVILLGISRIDSTLGCIYKKPV